MIHFITLHNNSPVPTQRKELATCFQLIPNLFSNLFATYSQLDLELDSQLIPNLFPAWFQLVLNLIPRFCRFGILWFWIWGLHYRRHLLSHFFLVSKKWGKQGMKGRGYPQWTFWYTTGSQLIEEKKNVSFVVFPFFVCYFDVLRPSLGTRSLPIIKFCIHSISLGCCAKFSLKTQGGAYKYPLIFQFVFSIQFIVTTVAQAAPRECPQTTTSKSGYLKKN